jgi:hypothetical protein
MVSSSREKLSKAAMSRHRFGAVFGRLRPFKRRRESRKTLSRRAFGASGARPPDKKR